MDTFQIGDLVGGWVCSIYERKSWSHAEMQNCRIAELCYE
jgi:hypothetical protein